MLTGKQKPDFQHAVFVVENAWFDNTHNEAQFKQQLNTAAQTCQQMVQQKNLQQYRTAGNWAIFAWMTQMVPENNNQPFNYDFADFTGKENFAHTFVTRALQDHTGNCLSLPLLYKCLAQQVGVEARLTLGPSHAWIRHLDEEGKWANVKLTSGRLPSDGLMMTELGISTEAIKSGAYFKALSEQEALAFLLTQLVLGYEHKFGHLDTFTERCTDLSLAYFRPNVVAYMLKANHLAHKSQMLLASKKAIRPSWTRYTDSMWRIRLNCARSGLIASLRRLMRSGSVRCKSAQPNKLAIFSYMKRLLTLLTILLGTILSAFAQGDSPYARFGYEGKVLRTPQERQQRMMQLVANPDSTAIVATVGLDPAQQKYYLFDKRNQVLTSDTLAATTVSRFLSTDPLTAKYAWYTPYQFAGNKPIQFVDIDGLEEGLSIQMGVLERGYLRGTVTAKELHDFHRANAIPAAAGIAFVGGYAAPAVAGAVLRYGAPIVSSLMTSSTLAPGIVGTIASVFDPNPASDYPGLGDDLAKGIRYVFGYKWGRAAVELSSGVGATFANQSEKQITGMLLEEGKSVHPLAEKSTKSFDAFVDGVATEFKSLEGTNMSGADPGRKIKSVLEYALKEQRAHDIILDARGFGGKGVDRRFIDKVLNRFAGVNKDADYSIRVIGDGFESVKTGTAPKS